MARKELMLLGSTLAFALHAGSALAADAVVPGSANPNLAGRDDDGYTCCSGDSRSGGARRWSKGRS